MWSFVTGFFHPASCFQGSSMCGLYQYLIPFNCQITFRCRTISRFIYPYVRWWVLGLFLLFDYYDYSCDEHFCISFCGDVYFHSLGCIPCSEIAGAYDSSMFNILRNCWTIFLIDWTTCTLQQCLESCSFSASLPICVVICPLSVLIDHFCIFFEETYI